MVAWVQVSDSAAEMSCEIRMWLLLAGIEERILKTPIANYRFLEKLTEDKAWNTRDPFQKSKL